MTRLLALAALVVGCSGDHVRISMAQAAIDTPQVAIAKAVTATPPVNRPQPREKCVNTVAELDIDLSDERLYSDQLIVVRKHDRRLMLFNDGKIGRDRPGDSENCWKVGLGPNPSGDKNVEGDGRTPEGWYQSSDKPWSQWYGAIAIHYPSVEDADRNRERITDATYRSIAKAERAGTLPPQSSALGGQILLHGQGNSDWTLGCIAMQNHDLDELRELLPQDKRTWFLILP